MINLFVAALLLGMVASWLVARGQPPIIGGITQAISTVGLLLMLATIPHVTWVSERTLLPPAHTILTALAVGLRRPILTIAILVIGLGWPLLLIYSGWPGILLLSGVSVPLLLSAWCVNRAFPSRFPHTEDGTEGQHYLRAI